MSKNIVLCCDGTGQQFQDNKANPLRLHYCLANDESQISFYDPGVGTLTEDDSNSGIAGSLASTAGAFVGGKMLGYGVVKNIEDAYRYLMNTYEVGDEVSIFGFSRGAFTAHAVAGLLAKCGLLGRHNDNLVPYTLEIYLQKGNQRIADDFKATMGRECKVHFLGVWDTVKSLGPAHADDFFYEDVKSICTYGCHAVAIHEKRSDFYPSLWPTMDAARMQVWFNGVHGDVGGGYPEDGIANVALQYMIAQAKNYGVKFNEERVKQFPANYKDVMHETYDAMWMIRNTEERSIPERSDIHRSVIARREEGLENAVAELPHEYSVQERHAA